jgi:hypothetical protein
MVGQPEKVHTEGGKPCDSPAPAMGRHTDPLYRNGTARTDDDARGEEVGDDEEGSHGSQAQEGDSGRAVCWGILHPCSGRAKVVVPVTLVFEQDTPLAGKATRPVPA